MKSKMNKKMICLIIEFIIMVGLIFLTVFLTGGREIGDFNGQDKLIFTVFIILELINFVVMMIIANKLGHENPPPEPIALPQTVYQKTLQKRGLLLLIAAVALAVAATVCGILVSHSFPAIESDLTLIIFVAALLIPVICFLLSILLQKLYIRRFANKSVAQIQSFMLSHRERAEKTAAKKLEFLKKWKTLCDLYAVLLGILGAVCGFFGGVGGAGSSTGFTIYSAFLFLCALSRIRFRTLEIFFDEDDSCLSPEDYPELFTLAQRAANKLECREKIKIMITPNYNAGISKESGLYCIHLGVMLASILSEEELYHILLHEFAHVTKENSTAMTERRYAAWLENGNQHYLSNLTQLMYSYADAVYSLQFTLYLYASSIQLETAADRAMATYGDAKIAASSLIKLKYRDLYEWEDGTYDEKCIYEPESPDPNLLKNDISNFLSAMERRREDWNALIDKEIISRQASHPTLKMRLESLGVSSHDILPADSRESYAAEIRKALDLMSDLVCKANEENYSEARKTRYLEPLEKIGKWEEAGRPVIAEEYADICAYLRLLGRNLESNELCRRAIDELPSPANLHGHYMHGCFLLHTYDPAGLDHLYHAIENNTNYIEEGLQIIGEYCCMVGDQEELDSYREKAVDIGQKEKDLYSKINTISKGDDLSAESLPDGMLDGIIDFVKSIDGGKVAKLYLVRKTITPEFFTSAVVVDFKESTDSDDISEIMHRIFLYLDTSTDWQFSLFNYQNVAKVKVENIQGSLVYKAE